MSFKMNDYNDVASRIREFREKHPDGSLQQQSLEFKTFGGKDWIVYTAAAYRTPDDQRPGIGTAWEQVPGKTNFTKDSELQNAETAAWGRALIAVGAADAKKGVASREEIQNRGAAQADPAFIPSDEANDLMGRVRGAKTLNNLELAWESVNSAHAINIITETEFAALKTQVKTRKQELEKAA